MTAKCYEESCGLHCVSVEAKDYSLCPLYDSEFSVVREALIADLDSRGSPFPGMAFRLH